MVDTANVRSGLVRWCDALETAAPELNRLDARLGDGDLGTTLQRCSVLVREVLPATGDDLASVFKACAAACAKASGSSFGTLLAVAFMTASKRVQGRDTLDRAALAELLDEIVGALSARGGAVLGDKTMLDSLHSVAQALAKSSDGADLRQVARQAAAGALDAMRSQPNRIGRARMFADKSVGADDPGMLAVLRMTESL